LISREEALNLIEGSTKHDHSILVSRIMKGIAERLGENRAEWELVGLLHDLDYDAVKGDMSRHGIAAARILEGRLSEEGLYAIKSHDQRAGFTPRSLLDRSLIAADAIAIFIEDQGIRDVEGKEVLAAKLDDESADKPWISDAILAFCRERGLQLVEFLKLGLNPDIDTHSSKDWSKERKPQQENRSNDV